MNKIIQNKITFKIVCSFFVALFIMQSAAPSFAGQSMRRAAKNTRSYRRLVWSDEFSVDGRPNKKKWTYDIGCGGWGNEESQCYSKKLKNVRVENGLLIIEARRNGYGRKKYTSGRLTTRGKASWKYCRIEIRAKLPTGRGVWPAIWMLPARKKYGKRGWPDTGEIDIMENVGSSPNWIHATLHTNTYNWMNRRQRTSRTKVVGSYKSFHVYAFEWYPNRMDFYVDGKRFFTARQPRKPTWKNWPFDVKFYLILNVAIGGTWGGKQGIKNSIFPQKMEIDYIRVYQ